MIELTLNKTNSLQFSLLVEGNEEPLREARLTFLTNPRISFVGSLEKENLNFSLTNISKYLTEGEYDVKLEVFIGESCFTTYEGKANLIKPIEVKSSLVEAKSTQKVVVETKTEEKPKEKSAISKFLTS